MRAQYLLKSAVLIVLASVFFSSHASTKELNDGKAAGKFDLSEFEGFEADDNGVDPPTRKKIEIIHSLKNDGNLVSTVKAIQCLVANQNRCVVIETSSTKFPSGKEKVRERVYKADAKGNAI